MNIRTVWLEICTIIYHNWVKWIWCWIELLSSVWGWGTVLLRLYFFIGAKIDCWPSCLADLHWMGSLGNLGSSKETQPILLMALGTRHKKNFVSSRRYNYFLRKAYFISFWWLRRYLFETLLQIKIDAEKYLDTYNYMLPILTEQKKSHYPPGNHHTRHL